jgi:hypothetical protein
MKTKSAGKAGNSWRGGGSQLAQHQRMQLAHQLQLWPVAGAVAAWLCSFGVSCGGCLWFFRLVCSFGMSISPSPTLLFFQRRMLFTAHYARLVRGSVYRVLAARVCAAAVRANDSIHAAVRVYAPRAPLVTRCTRCARTKSDVSVVRAG